MENQGTGNTAVLTNKRIEGTNVLSYDTDTAPYRIKGNLKRHIGYWKDTLKADKFILSVIENGYKIPLRYNLPPFKMKNNKSALENSDFIEKNLFLSYWNTIEFMK